MLGEGGAEKVVADAIADRHGEVLVVTKAYPHHASRTELPKACGRSLKRLRLDVIDLYLLHWRGDVPLEETVETFEKLCDAGKVRRWGVSNFDLDDLEELLAIENGPNCAANQVLYNLERREIEFDLLPVLQTSGLKHQTAPIPIMAYAPVGHGRGLLDNPTLKRIAQVRDASSAQVAIAWVLRQPSVIAIAKASNKTHVRENAGSAEIELTSEDLA